MNIITEYALEQLHKEGITLDMLTTALTNMDKIEGYNSSDFISTLIARRKDKDKVLSSENAKYKILITPVDSSISSKLALVKLVKDAFGLGLKEAKDAVDSAPSIIDRYLTIDEFDKIHKWIIEQDDRYANNIRLNI
jgi:ribosomal protein L7/L12